MNFGIYRPGAAPAAPPVRNQPDPVINAPTYSGSSGAPSTAHEDRTAGAQLSDFMQQLEDYVPTVPDAVTAFYLNSGGFETSDPRIVRLISVATQKFISDIAIDALQHSKCKMRHIQQYPPMSAVPGGTKPQTQRKEKDRKYTLTIEDLQPALSDFGITVRKAQYYQ